jgi:hypothetical protein
MRSRRKRQIAPVGPRCPRLVIVNDHQQYMVHVATLKGIGNTVLATFEAESDALAWVAAITRALGIGGAR